MRVAQKLEDSNFDAQALKRATPVPNQSALRFLSKNFHCKRFCRRRRHRRSSAACRPLISDDSRSARCAGIQPSLERARCEARGYCCGTCAIDAAAAGRATRGATGRRSRRRVPHSASSHMLGGGSQTLIVRRIRMKRNGKLGSQRTPARVPLWNSAAHPPSRRYREGPSETNR